MLGDVELARAVEADADERGFGRQREIGAAAGWHEQHRRHPQRIEMGFVVAEVAADHPQLGAGPAQGIDVAGLPLHRPGQRVAHALEAADQQCRFGLGDGAVVALGIAGGLGSVQRSKRIEHALCQHQCFGAMATEHQHGRGIDTGEIATRAVEGLRVDMAGLDEQPRRPVRPRRQREILEQATLQRQPFLDVVRIVEVEIVADAQFPIAPQRQLGAAGVGQRQQREVIKLARAQAVGPGAFGKIVAKQVVAGLERRVARRQRQLQRSKRQRFAGTGDGAAIAARWHVSCRHRWIDQQQRPSRARRAAKMQG